MDIELDKLKDDFSFVCLFVMAFEQFVSYWKIQFITLYSNFDLVNVDTGEITPQFVLHDPITDERTEDKESKEKCNRELLKCYKNEKGRVIQTLSICKFMKNHLNAIDDTDFMTLTNISRRRNQFVHEFYKELSKGITEDDIRLLKELLRIRKKVSEFWVKEVEELTGGFLEQYDENCEHIEIEAVLRYDDMVMDYFAKQLVKEINDNEQTEHEKY
ncbi:MAG: hypothetical protein NC048_04590 [Bacteroides sp.]|nr:hypothetical protein [Ruminococcus flavefaciens]MCM1554753.1 hypothetical protein [Bacteroides sp.]